MVLDAEETAKRYEQGIKDSLGGADAYIECGKEKDKGFLAVAECLQNKKEKSLTLENMVKRYKAAAKRT